MGEDEKQLSPGEILENMRRDFKDLIECQASLAIILKAKHDALLKAGFNKVEALEIIKARGMNP